MTTNLAITDGAAAKDWVLLIGGNVFIIILVVRGLAHYAKKEWGELIGFLGASIVVASFVYFPTQTIDFIKQILKFFGIG